MEATAVLEPQTMKISSERQATIPAKVYKEMGFSDYALVEQTREGLLIRPLNVDDDCEPQSSTGGGKRPLDSLTFARGDMGEAISLRFC